MRKKKQKQVKQLINYIKFVAMGIVLVIIVALVSGCGSRVENDGGSSQGKKVLSKAEIQELTDLVAVDAEENSNPVYDEDWEEEVEGIDTEDSDSNSHYTYILGYRDDGKDEEEEYDEESEKLLVQVFADQKILQTFSESEIALHPGKKEEEIELEGVTDQEIICSANLYEDDFVIWYRIPLSYENGQEKLLCDKKEILYQNEDWEGSLYDDVGKYLLCADIKGLFVLNKENGEKQNLDFGILGNYGYCNDLDSWIDPAGELHTILTEYQDDMPNALHMYQTETKSMKKITDGITSESPMTSGEGKIFFTGLVNPQKSNDYNLYVYDMETEQKKVLAWEREIRDMLPGNPADQADIIRELVYAQGNLYLEIRYGDECYVLACTPDEGTLTLLEGMPELVKHREYYLSKSIKKGNDRYCNMNDHNIYEKTDEGVVERTLDGAYVRTIHLAYPYTLIYVNNQELIYQYIPDACAAPVFCSVPLTQIDGNDYPEISRMAAIVRGDDKDAAGEVWMGQLYADERYLVYRTSLRCFEVYDRRAKSFIDIMNLPEYGQSFGERCIQDHKCGDSIYLSSTYKSEEGYGYQLSLYHVGDKKMSRIDPTCFTSGNACWSGDGKKIIYERLPEEGKETAEYCAYDISTGDRELLFADSDLQKLVNMDNCDSVEMKLVADKLYLFMYCFGEEYQDNRYKVCSYDLSGENGLQYESQISALLEEGKGWDWQYYVVEGKLILAGCQEDEEMGVVRDSEKYFYYDLGTGENGSFDRQDPEWLYLSFC